MLKDFLPPHIYRIDNQPNYFDPVRKKYVLVTPRETVRQRVVLYLIKELDVPQRMIRIGEKLSHYGLPCANRYICTFSICYLLILFELRTSVHKRLSKV